VQTLPLLILDLAVSLIAKQMNFDRLLMFVHSVLCETLMYYCYDALVFFILFLEMLKLLHCFVYFRLKLTIISTVVKLILKT